MTDTFSDYFDCTPLLDDREALDRFYEEHGYLYLRGALDRVLVRTAAEQMLEGLIALGHAAPGTTLDTLTIDSFEAVDEVAMHDYVKYDDLWNHPSSVKGSVDPAGMRMSMDTRIQPASSHRGFNALTPWPESAKDPSKGILSKITGTPTTTE